MTVEIVVYILLAANGIFSWQGFENANLFNRFKFRVGDILGKNDYIRMLSSGFLHADWTHLIINMIALYSFGTALGYYKFLNTWQFIALYFTSLIAGNLLALFFNKNNYNYSAIGASGAVSGVVFASVIFQPFSEVLLFFILPLKSWIFGILYLLYTVYGMNKKNDNIGHEAHLGGAVTGVLIAIAFTPSVATDNLWLTVILLVIPLVLFFIKPKSAGGGYKFTILNDKQNVKRTKRSIDDLYYNEEFEKEKELNNLLEKVNELGIGSLTKKEQQRLNELSQ